MKRFPSQRVPMYETSAYVPPQHYLEKILDGGAAMREREAELRARLAQGVCRLCGLPVPDDRKIRRTVTPASTCSTRCKRLIDWVSDGRMTLERAQELATVPAGYVAQIARTNRTIKPQSKHSRKYAAMGRKGGSKTAERGPEYYRQIAAMRKTFAGRSWLNIPVTVSERDPKVTMASCISASNG